MSTSNLILGIICLLAGIIILANNINNISTDLKNDKFGNHIKFYGGAVLLIGAGLYIIVRFLFF